MRLKFESLAASLSLCLRPSASTRQLRPAKHGCERPPVIFKLAIKFVSEASESSSCVLTSHRPPQTPRPDGTAKAQLEQERLGCVFALFSSGLTWTEHLNYHAMLLQPPTPHACFAHALSLANSVPGIHQSSAKSTSFDLTGFLHGGVGLLPEAFAARTMQRLS